MTKSMVDNLVYIDDYIDSKHAFFFSIIVNVFTHFFFLHTVIEALQIDLQKNFTLLKEMDGYAQGKKKRKGQTILYDN